MTGLVGCIILAAALPLAAIITGIAKSTPFQMRKSADGPSAVTTAAARR